MVQRSGPRHRCLAVWPADVRAHECLWPHGETDPDGTATTREFAGIWKATPKIVFSTSLDTVEGNAWLVRGDDVRGARGSGRVPGDLDVGGPTLAASFIRRGLVDAYRLVVHPVMLGAGTPFFPTVDEPLRLRLVETHQFASGVVYQGYESA